MEASVRREYPALMSVLVQRYFRDKDCSQIGSNRLEAELAAMHKNLAGARIQRSRLLDTIQTLA